jgi:hypothetical protein
MKTYEEAMWSAVEDTLEEMYQYSYPKVSWKQRMQDAKEGKDVDKDLIHHHYIPQRLYEDILEMAKVNYSYEPFFQDYIEHFADFLIKGGHGKDLEKGGKDDYKDYTSIKEEIGEEAFTILEKRIEVYKSTYRFDHRRWSFVFSVMNYSPTTNRQAVIDYWKSQGVNLDIPTDQQIIDLYWDGEYEDENGNIVTRDGDIY